MSPLIIPLRDPLLALITAKNRDQFGHHQGLQIAKVWGELVAHIDAERDFYQPFYVPLDLLTEGKYEIPGVVVPEGFGLTARRRSKLVQVLSIAGLHDTDTTEQSSFKHAQKWAGEWPHTRHNSRGMYPLKEAYLAGDVKKIRDAMPKAYYFLQQAEGALRPMLEREGYRELMWWTQP